MPQVHFLAKFVYNCLKASEGRILDDFIAAKLPAITEPATATPAPISKVNIDK